MSLREQIEAAVKAGDEAGIEEIVSKDNRAVRHLLRLSYRPQEREREVAARGLARAARFHPQLVDSVIRRLVWAMDNESGSNALTAPDVLLEIARERPELLVPYIPDLVRRAGDRGLRKGLEAALRLVVESCPGALGRGVTDALNARFGVVAARDSEGDSSEPALDS